MTTILIYSLLFAFWAERVLGFTLTQVRGLSLMNLNIYLLALVWALAVVRKRKLFEPTSVNKYLILMFFVDVNSVLVKIALSEIQNINILDELIAVKNWANPFLLFFIIFNTVHDENTCKRILLGLVVLLVVTVSTTLLITFGGIEIGMLEVREDQRSSGFANPVEYASYLVLFTPLLFSLLLFEKRVLVKMAVGLILIMTLCALFTTGSRGGALSFLVGVSVLIFILKRYRMISATWLAPVVIVAMMLGSYAVVPSKVKRAVMERFDPQTSGDLYEYTSGRTKIWRCGLGLFMERPFFGHGRASFSPLIIERCKIRAVAHNQYLSHLVQYGLIGLAIFVALLVRVFQDVKNHFRTTLDPWRKKLYSCYLAGFLGYAFSMLGLNVYFSRYFFWMYTAVILKYCQLEVAVPPRRVETS